MSRLVRAVRSGHILLCSTLLSVSKAAVFLNLKATPSIASFDRFSTYSQVSMRRLATGLAMQVHGRSRQSHMLVFNEQEARMDGMIPGLDVVGRETATRRLKRVRGVFRAFRVEHMTLQIDEEGEVQHVARINHDE